MDATFETMEAIPQRIASLKCGKEVSNVSDLELYLNCEQGFLFMTEILGYSARDAEYKAVYNRDYIYLFLDILDRCADSAPYKALQIQLSRIVLHWLKKSDNVLFETLPECKQLSGYKLDCLLNGNVSKHSSDNYGLNLSDVVFLQKMFNVSYFYMFTGEHEQDADSLYGEISRLKQKHSEFEK